MADAIVVRASESDAGLDPKAGANFDNKSSGKIERVTLDSTKQSETDDSQGKSLIAGKFKTQDELLAAYKALEQKLGGQGKQEEPKKETPIVKPVDTSKVDLSDLKSEFAKDGKLSEESYKKAEAKGLSRADVDQYLAVQKANAEKYVEDVAKSVGGRENLNTLIEWANSNLTQGQAKAINAALQSGDVDQATVALEGLNARYQTATGKDPELVGGEAKGSRAGAEAYGDVSEMVAEMSDPRYRTSEAFRKRVESRIAAGMGSSVSVRVV